ncbi:Pimeloyl-ACP methyl ester carboxylesterase [Muriicola jejuensis]|uniref:Alpha/beta fold hydrolase n=1 Tax=Muriicola jejuensis TaxID=504488 RepID=A0A6P0UG76_9FLAO|nr:alpha/beta hydrolase [Muriicola jejuensis]NER10788.1 alpha/beta fold hydrolase [Muriicola jejuensis]SMP16251.1 Pimeloyl-ACP methyl ester carboxylesterase [Muriicola jejuensis]
MKKFALLLLNLIVITQIWAQENTEAFQVKVTGEGAPVILIPGFTVPGEIWDPLVSELEKQYECHVVTLAGFGGVKPLEFPWLPKINNALEKYLQTKDLKNVTVIGHSLGGTIATWLASREGARLSRIILVDALPAAGALMFPDYSPEKLSYDSLYNTQQLNMSEADFEQMAGFMTPGMSLNPEGRGRIKSWILEADRKTYVYGYTDYLKLDMREDLKKIDIPVIILAADHPFGREAVEQTYRNQYANLPAYELIIAENAAHFLMLDQPEWFSEQIHRALSSH